MIDSWHKNKLFPAVLCFRSKHPFVSVWAQREKGTQLCFSIIIRSRVMCSFLSVNAMVNKGFLLLVVVVFVALILYNPWIWYWEQNECWRWELIKISSCPQTPATVLREPSDLIPGPAQCRSEVQDQTSGKISTITRLTIIRSANLIHAGWARMLI